MKLLLGISATVLGLFAMAGLSRAQDINWGLAENISGDADVANYGTAFDAASFYSSALTINGVTFNPIVAGSDASGDITITAPNGTSGASTPPGTGSANYNNLLSVLGFGYQQGGAVTLSNLTIGDNYQVEAWSWWFAGSGVQVTFTGDTPVTVDAGIGQFAIGTFTADSTSETFDYDNQGGPGNPTYGMIDAVSVQQTQSVPEPATYGMMLAGLGTLLVGQRIRRRIGT